MSDQVQQESKEARFVAYLEKLAARDDRASLAALRRGLGREPASAVEMYPIVVPWLKGSGRTSERAYFMVASLFGLYPSKSWRNKDGRNDMGKTLALIRLKGSESLDQRFVALLNAHEDEIDDHLRHAISLAKASELPVNWLQLLKDIIHWSNEKKFVQKAWAKNYWGNFEDPSNGA